MHSERCASDDRYWTGEWMTNARIMNDGVGCSKLLSLEYIFVLKIIFAQVKPNLGFMTQLLTLEIQLKQQGIALVWQILFERKILFERVKNSCLKKSLFERVKNSCLNESQSNWRPQLKYPRWIKISTQQVKILKKKSSWRGAAMFKPLWSWLSVAVISSGQVVTSFTDHCVKSVSKVSSLYLKRKAT